MTAMYKKIGKINNELVLTVTAKASSLSVTLPREICETYNIIAGDRIQIKLEDHFKSTISH